MSLLSCSQRSRTQVNLDSVKIFKTPRKLIHSLQELNDATSDCSEKQNRRIRRSLSSGNIEWSPTSNSEYDQNGFADHENYDDCEENESLYADEQFPGGSESVSSTDDLPGDADKQMPPEVVPEDGNYTQTFLESQLRMTKCKLVCGLSFVLLAVATPLLWFNSQEEGHYLVPT